MNFSSYEFLFLPSVWSLQPLTNFFKTFHLFLIFRMSCYLSILSTFFSLNFAKQEQPSNSNHHESHEYLSITDMCIGKARFWDKYEAGQKMLRYFYDRPEVSVLQIKIVTQQEFVCSKSTVETLEKSVKYVQS